MLLTEYDAKKQRKMDRADAKEEGREEGRAEGRAEGREEGREEKTKDFVLNMLKKGMPDEVICELAECNQEFVDKVRAEMM